MQSRDREDGRATWQPYRGIDSEAYLNGTLQGPTPEDARLPARRAYSSERRTTISVEAVTPGRECMKYPGSTHRIEMQVRITRAAQVICQSKKTLALTGAGISVESGIPDFRSRGGLWERFDPIEYATIEAFKADPKKVWQMLEEVSVLLDQARPNPAHTGLARLQEMGLLQAIITQNIDNLHQEGGASRVIEYHGNAKTLSCLGCNQRYNANEIEGQGPPKCDCGKILKPNVVFFGEPIPRKALQ